MSETENNLSWDCVIDAGVSIGEIRPLHGANNGPICFGGLLSVEENYRALEMPWIRLHDCNWPADDVMDVHVVFPCFDADPDDPASYDFILTDQYIKTILDTGAKIVYRLGCRIEHTPHRRYAHPPKDFSKWARICRRIVRHYNEGWADGQHWDIHHWEIWNEPDIPPYCWSGTAEQYYELYAVTAKMLKDHDATLQIGGPAYSCATADHTFITQFLTICREEQVPLDFFSWHSYAGCDLKVWEYHALALRELLDKHGFAHVPSHLNEWNCFAHGDWKDFATFHTLLKGPEGASGDAASLIYFQDLPIDMAFYYTADSSIYGLFDQAGIPGKNYFALKAFRTMLDTPERCQAGTNDQTAGLAILAGKTANGTALQILLANYVHGARECNISLHSLPWSGATCLQQYLLDAEHNLSLVNEIILPSSQTSWKENIASSTVILYHLSPA